jgi:hypothetical protein
VVPVVAGSIIALRPHALDIEIWAPALECAGALFETADCVVAVEEGSVGEALCWIDSFGFTVVDDGGGVFVQAEFSLLARRFLLVAWIEPGRVGNVLSCLVSTRWSASEAPRKFSMYRMSGARESRCTRYPSGSPAQLNGTPSSGLMKLSSVTLIPGAVSSQDPYASLVFQGVKELGRNCCRSGFRTKRYTGTRYISHEMTVDNFGIDDIWIGVLGCPLAVVSW